MTSPILEPDGTEASSTAERGELAATSDCRAAGSESPTQHATTSGANSEKFVRAATQQGMQLLTCASANTIVDRRFPSDAGEEMKDDSGAPDHTDEDEINRIEETEDPREFARFESDAESDDGDDDESSLDDAEDVDVQLPIPTEMQFGSQFISDIGGLENIASGAVPDEVLKKMGVDGWTDTVTHT
ncbi:hypothetical protein JG688_00015072, partial [Phytophthora aleatoria]